MHEPYLHTLSPFILHLWGSFGIRWYGLAYLAGFYFGYLAIRWMCERDPRLMDPKLAGDFVFTVALGTVIGGRLGYCLFYSPALLTEFTASPPFWGVLALHKGGMASHGGIVGVIVAASWYARRKGYSALTACDLTTIGGTIGIFFGRIANFINGELVGREAPPGLPWAVKFPQDILAWPITEPEKLTTLTPVVKTLGISADSWAEMAQSQGSFPAVESILQQIVSMTQRGVIDVQNALAPLLTARHPSQLYEALLEGLFLFALLAFVWRKPRRPGVITGVFITVYPLVRIVGEQFRMPDVGIGYQWLGLTRGQWLSVAMFVITSVVTFIWSRQKRDKVGGWMEAPAKPQTEAAA